MNSWLFLSLLLAHVIGDFYLQNDIYCAQKEKRKFKFVVIGQYEAIGFIIAAKSILRFKDTDTAKTEYVLAGTFLSFGIALLCGLMATK